MKSIRVVITCDTRACPNTHTTIVQGPSRNLTRASAERAATRTAADRGWTRDNGYDRCPDCEAPARIPIERSTP